MIHSLPSVICFGEALVDRLGPLGGDPSRDKPCDDCFGGAPANVACGLARLGTDVAFIGRLGNDDIGKDFRQLMISRGVNLIGLQVDFHRPSRIVLVRRNKKGERTFYGFAGDQGDGFADQAIDLYQLQVVFEKLLQKATWLLIGSIPLASKMSRKTLIWLVKMSRKKQINLALDINWRPTFWNSKSSPSAGPDSSALEEIQYLIDHASLLKLAREEADWFFDNDDPKVISSLLANNPDVVITDGANPIKWFIGREIGITEVQAPDVVIDTTGAGDSFTAGLLHKLVDNSYPTNSSLDLKAAVNFASGCGAITCSASGAISPQPTKLEVERFLNYT